MSLMPSAPAIMPMTTARIFAVAFAAPRATIRSRSVSSVASPHRGSAP